MNVTVYTGPLRASGSAPSLATGARAEQLRAYLILAKPRIVSLVLFTALVACFAAAQGQPPLGTVLLLVVSGSLSAGGAAALNHYFERDIDARMGRTRRRPLASGQIRHPSLVLLGGMAAIVVGVALAGAVNLALAGFELAGAFVYAAIYTLWLKRRTALNIVIGGAAGGSAVLGGWAAVDPGLGLVPWLLAGLVFAWTPAHFWSLALARSGEYERAGVPMLPALVGPRGVAWWVAVHILATVALSIGIGVAAHLGPLYFVAALAAAVGFLRAGVQLVQRPGAVTGWRLFKFSGIYLGLVFLGLLAETLRNTL
ncbi:MAG: protoheme IX farnesyltransferase [Chloroflexi bacterium]|nr:protoheme IX farnesyltransferase [Chloroflexota bacterium]